MAPKRKPKRKPKPSVAPKSTAYPTKHEKGKNPYQLQEDDVCPTADYHSLLKAGETRLTFRRQEWLKKSLWNYANRYPSIEPFAENRCTKFAIFKSYARSGGLNVAIGSPDGTEIQAPRTAFHELVKNISRRPWKPFDKTVDPTGAVQTVCMRTTFLLTTVLVTPIVFLIIGWLCLFSFSLGSVASWKTRAGFLRRMLSRLTAAGDRLDTTG